MLNITPSYRWLAFHLGEGGFSLEKTDEVRLPPRGRLFSLAKRRMRLAFPFGEGGFSLAKRRMRLAFPLGEGGFSLAKSRMRLTPDYLNILKYLRKHI